MISILTGYSMRAGLIVVESCGAAVVHVDVGAYYASVPCGDLAGGF